MNSGGKSFFLRFTAVSMFILGFVSLLPIIGEIILFIPGTFVLSVLHGLRLDTSWVAKHYYIGPLYTFPGKLFLVTVVWFLPASIITFWNEFRTSGNSLARCSNCGNFSRFPRMGSSLLGFKILRCTACNVNFYFSLNLFQRCIYLLCVVSLFTWLALMGLIMSGNADPGAAGITTFVLLPPGVLGAYCLVLDHVIQKNTRVRAISIAQQSAKAIFFGLAIIIGALFAVGTLMTYTIYPVLGRMGSSFSYKLVGLIPSIVAGLSSGYFVALIARRKEIVHTLIVVGLYTLMFHVPSLMPMRQRNSSDEFVHVFVHLIAITIPAIITASRVSKKRAQQSGPADALSGAADL